MTATTTQTAMPAVDSWLCSKCEGCVSVCPSVFYVDPVSGDIGVEELDHYPAEEVFEAMRDCPKDCISSEE